MTEALRIPRLTIKNRVDKSIERQEPSWRNFLSRMFIGKRADGMGLGQENLRSIDYFSRMIDRTEKYLASHDISYEGYIEEVISVFKDAPRKILISIVNDYFEYDDDLALKAVNTLAPVDKKLCFLLVDPGIALRVSEFARFSASRKGLDPLIIRREFIASFPLHTFFRAIKLESEERLLPNSHLAPDVRRIVEMPTDEYIKHLRNDLEWVVKNYDPIRQADYFEIPFFSRFSERARRHLGNSDTNSQFISVSKFSQVSWYVVADNGMQIGNSWPDGASVVIYSFEMNSYYAFSRNNFFDSTNIKETKIKVEDFEINARNEGVEYLIPIGLPSNFFIHSETYTKHDGQIPSPR